MNHFLSQLHSELRRTHITHAGATHAPKDVPQGIHKEYPRMEHVPLPSPTPLSMTLSDALATRVSATSGDAHTPLSLSELGTLFGHALGKKAHAFKRNYPSGGGLYPVETYLIATAVELQTPAVFHYHPNAHALERLWDLPEHFSMKDVSIYGASLPFSSLIVFTSLWHRSSAKYGHLAYLHALLEAGHMSQNILLVATALGLASRPLAGFKDDKVSKLLDLNRDAEQPLLVISLGKTGVQRPQSSELE